jgi:hypothetical protein
VIIELDGQIILVPLFSLSVTAQVDDDDDDDDDGN